MRVAPYRRRCADSPEEYCNENYGWAWADLENVIGWLDEVERDLYLCCKVHTIASPTTPPAKTCDNWQEAWAELQSFGNDIFDFLVDAEAKLEGCSGAKISPKIPKPKNGPLPGKKDRALEKQACSRAKHYFKQWEKWANEFRNAFNDHCDDHETTHLSPPPDPPF